MTNNSPRPPQRHRRQFGRLQHALSANRQQSPATLQQPPVDQQEASANRQAPPAAGGKPWQVAGDSWQSAGSPCALAGTICTLAASICQLPSTSWRSPWAPCGRRCPMTVATEHLLIGRKHLRVRRLSLRGRSDPSSRSRNPVQGRSVSVGIDFTSLADCINPVQTSSRMLRAVLNRTKCACLLSMASQEHVRGKIGCPRSDRTWMRSGRGHLRSCFGLLGDPHIGFGVGSGNGSASISSAACRSLPPNIG